MKFFLDTADIDEIKKANSLGLCNGVTTNPSIIMKSGRDHKEVIREIAEIVDGPVSVEGIADTAEEMVREGEEFNSWADNVVVKIPMTEEGMRAVMKLSEKGIKTNVTLIFSAAQALVAAKAGASFVSPFVGRLDDVSEDGMQLISDTLAILAAYDYDTEVIVASVRHPLHVIDSARMGAQIATIPPSVLAKLFKHPLTDKGIEKFKADHEKHKKNVG
jgi:transaldolase